MKKVINGKVYNTETATEIGHYWNGLSDRDFNHLSETLYKTAKGNYFLAGEGGPLTKYSHSCGDNSWSGGVRIIPLTREEAFDWAQESLSEEVVFSEFSDLIEEA